VEASPLEAEIRKRIAIAGPMPVRQYMTLCLGHPEHGYYMSRDPFGRAGDFITAPEITQMFGELIGLWAASVWRLMGSPDNVRLVELGPGRGTLMHDALRAARVLPEFRAAIVAHLVEISPVLRERQQATLTDVDVPMHWHDSVSEVPDGPLIVIANEFFDALPVSQTIRTFNGWYERTVEIDRHGHLVFGIANEPLPLFENLLPPQIRDAPLGTIYEWRSDSLALEIARRIVSQGGAGLVVDYGYTEPGIGETLQAVQGHDFVSPLATPGRADITAHVDFWTLGRAIESMGAQLHGPVTQAEFLGSLGIARRAAALRANATPAKADEIDEAVARLVRGGRTGMGALFKVLGFGAMALGALPGFESAAAAGGDPNAPAEYAEHEGGAIGEAQTGDGPPPDAGRPPG
jgi:NADH dehydrogenase [ubiquinone] 1 alpha subcomplex assembly factor 7